MNIKSGEPLNKGLLSRDLNVALAAELASVNRRLDLLVEELMELKTSHKALRNQFTRYQQSSWIERLWWKS